MSSKKDIFWFKMSWSKFYNNFNNLKTIKTNNFSLKINSIKTINKLLPFKKQVY